MPTPSQITSAQTQLEPQPYNAATSKLSDNAQADLFTFLRKYLYNKKKAGGYTLLATKLDEQVGRKAAQLQAVLNNVGGVGSKVARLKGELDYSTQENIDNELEFALFVMYEPVSVSYMGTMPSEMATAIRSCTTCVGVCCCGNEYQRTRCKDLV